MKKNILILSTALLVGASVFMTGCNKDDTTAPVVTLVNGDMSLLLQDSYVDPGATANDDEDGVLTAQASGTVNTNLVGVYTITYTATDAAGNEGTATRTVTVMNGAEAWEGKYDGQEEEPNLTPPPATYFYSGNTDATKTVTIAISQTTKNQVTMTRLGDFKNCVVTLNITGTTVTLPSQDAVNIGDGAGCFVATHTFSGTGTKTGTGFTLTYNDTKKAPCTGTRSGVVATFTKK